MHKKQVSLQVNTVYWSSWYAFITTWSLCFKFGIFLKLGVDVLMICLTEAKLNAVEKKIQSWKQSKLFKKNRELNQVVALFQLWRELEQIIISVIPALVK